MTKQLGGQYRVLPRIDLKVKRSVSPTTSFYLPSLLSAISI